MIACNTSYFIKPRSIKFIDIFNAFNTSSTDSFNITMSHSQTNIYTETLQDMIIKDINNIQSECNIPDWDEEGVKTISKYSITNSKEFVNYFDDKTPKPNIAPYQTGEIGFTWQKDNTIFTIIFSASSNEIIWSICSNTEDSMGTYKRNIVNQKEIITKVKEIFVNEV